MPKNIKICSRCGIVFDLEYRPNKDCPLCHGAEHTSLRQNNEE